MATISRPNTYAPGDSIVSDEVNDDFDTLYTAANNTLVHVDGSKAFTGVPVLPASDPVSANQAARKQYVDSRTAGVLAKAVVPNNSNTFHGGTMQTVGVQVSFPMPDLSASGRAVRLDLSASGILFSGGDNSSTAEIRMVRGSDSTAMKFGFFTKGNALLNGPNVEMSMWLFDNGWFAAGTTAVVKIFAGWAGASGSAGAALLGAAGAPILFVASQV